MFNSAASNTIAGTAAGANNLISGNAGSNVGAGPGFVFEIIDPIPANTDFKLGSVTTSLGTTGLTSTVAYSDNGGSTRVYTPVSATGGAPAGYDGSVTHVRWSFSGTLSQTSPNNAGSVTLTARIE